MNDAIGAPQSVLVLGGGSEIGRAVVGALVRQRARTVVLAGRDLTEMEQAATQARLLGATRAEAVVWDATAIDGHSRFAEEAFARHGPFDLVLMAVGVLGDQRHDEHDPVAAAAVLGANLTGPATCLLAVADRMRAQGQGTIVVLSSVAGERVRRANFVYGASKAGLDGFAQGLDASLAGSGVRVMIVRPGFVRTKMTEGMPAAPLATTAAAVADAVVSGLGRRSRIVWVPGVLRWVFVALRHLPEAAFRRLPG